MTGDGWIAAGIVPGRAAQRLLVVTDAGEGPRALPMPPAVAPLQTEPALVVERGGLAGLAWLEGDGPTSYAVRVAEWEGAAWGAAVEVAPPAVGSQVALSAAVLGDRSWLLVWTAYDGTDDDVLWSRRDGDAWTPPRRLDADNAVPDIVPALAPVAGGALAAWSRYDGSDYRLRLARFDGRRWTELPWTGPAGSLYPAFERAREGLWLVYRSALPRGWAVLELGSAGLPRRRAFVAASDPETPAVAADGVGGVRLSWPEARTARAEWQPLP
jgi:hypothetical protein